MNTLKKKTLNLAVGAALGAAVAAPASADSLLAPLVVSDPLSQIQTFFQVKVQGKGVPDAQWLDPDLNEESTLHYYWFQKGSQVSDLRTDPAGWTLDHKWACEKTDNRGLTSSWDMIFQTLTANDGIGGVPPLPVGPPPLNPPTGFNPLPLPNQPGADQSVARFASGPFVGFMILDDEVGGVSVGYDPLNPNNPIPGKEGNFSGEAYVISFGENIILDYKLLNNHRTAKSGDFSAGFISKKTVDMQWWPETFATTEWLVLAVGPDMTGEPGNVPSSNLNWPGRILVTQSNFDGNDTRSPFGGQRGVYNNDEVVFSGEVPAEVHCMALLNKRDVMTLNQANNTFYGGWTRKNLQPIPDFDPTLANPFPPTSANGAIVYRFETGGPVPAPLPGQPAVPPPGYPLGIPTPVFPVDPAMPAAGQTPLHFFRNGAAPWSAFQIETSGFTKGDGRPNRPY